MGIRVFSGGGGGTAFTGGTLSSSLLVDAHNTYDLGTSAARWRTGYFGTEVVTPSVDSGAATNLVFQYNNTTELTIGNAAVSISNASLSGGGNTSSGFKINVNNNASTPVAVNNTGSVGLLFTNAGATAEIVFNLPTAVAGLVYGFYCADVDGLQINANTADTIRVMDKETAAAGYIDTTTIGSVVTLVAINATEWIATSIHGVWTDGTFTFSDVANTTP